MAKGWAVLMRALTTRARVALAQDQSEQAERDAHDALAGTPGGFDLGVADTLENDFESAWAEGAALSTQEAIVRAARARRTQAGDQQLGLTHPDRA
jgi:hypothetical protein